MKRNNFEDYKNYYTISKDWVVPYSQIQNKCKIILYGAGDVGQSYYYQIKITNYCEIVAWVDAEYKKYQDIGLDVNDISKINSYEFDVILVAVSDSQKARNINTYLINKGISQNKIIWNGNERIPFITNPKTYFVDDPVIEEAKRILEYNNISIESASGYGFLSKMYAMLESDKIVIPRLVIQLTQRCTLKCHGCNNLMPQFETPINYDIDRIMHDMDSLLKNVDKILVIELIGGEPFVHPEIATVIRYIKEKIKVDILEITTNGTIIPKDEVFKELTGVNTCIRISKYNTSNKIEELTKKCKDYSLKSVVMEDLHWFDSSSSEKRYLSNEELRYSYAKCPSAKFCKTLANGKIFCCARAASLADLNICDDDTNYIELSQATKNDIKNFLCRDMALACDYCTCTESWREIPPGDYGSKT